MSRSRLAQPVASLGAMLSVVISWDTNHSVLWAIFHALLSWIYVAYHVLSMWASS